MRYAGIIALGVWVMSFAIGTTACSKDTQPMKSPTDTSLPTERPESSKAPNQEDLQLGRPIPKHGFSEEDIAWVQKLIAAIDENPDPLHLDITPAVLELARLRWHVIPYLESSLLSNNEMTRLHAQRALEGAIMRYLGFEPGIGWQNKAGESRFRRLWKENGNYDYQASEAKRRTTVAAWQQWFETRSP